jgi:proteic killer suppression protein
MLHLVALAWFGTLALTFSAKRYTLKPMIRSFRDADAERLFQDECPRRFRAIERAARRKLYQLNRAASLRDLALPGNHLEALKGDRAGQHSIRINDQFRVCFVWSDGDALAVEIVDYH